MSRRVALGLVPHRIEDPILPPPVPTASRTAALVQDPSPSWRRARSVRLHEEGGDADEESEELDRAGRRGGGVRRVVGDRVGDGRSARARTRDLDRAGHAAVKTKARVGWLAHERKRLGVRSCPRLGALTRLANVPAPAVARSGDSSRGPFPRSSAKPGNARAIVQVKARGSRSASSWRFRTTRVTPPPSGTPSRRSRPSAASRVSRPCFPGQNETFGGPSLGSSH